MSDPAVFQTLLTADLVLRGNGQSDSVSTSIGSMNEEQFIRRPMRGIVVPTDTHASITIVGAGGSSKPEGRALYNTSAPPAQTTYYTHNFLLQNITETRNEKSQFITTFGATYGFFFGEQPRLINCTAILPNTADFEWHKEWWMNYEGRLRGTSLTSSNTKAQLRYGSGRDETIVSGYITNCTTIASSQDPYVIQLNFSMFVESVSRGELNPEAPRRDPNASGDLLGVGALASPDDQLRLDESTTAAVRRTNIKLSPLGSEPGTLGKLMGALNSIDAALDNVIRKARNFLYGRNMVVPLSFVGSGGPPRNSLFAEGSDVDALGNKTLTNFFGAPTLAFSDTPSAVKTVVLRTNTDGELLTDALLKFQRETSRYYFQNFDEYVNYPVDGTFVTDAAEAEATARFYRDVPERLLYSTQAVAAFAAFGIKVAPFPGSVPGTSRSALETQAVAYQQTLRTQAIISDALRLVGRGAYAIATLAIGNSIVNNRRELQESITNPNTGNLSKAQTAAMQSSIAEAQRTAEQRRLVQDARGAVIRGETGVIQPSTAETIMSVIL
jgi:hypothetical protein